jgi:hypothetical protein
VIIALIVTLIRRLIWEWKFRRAWKRIQRDLLQRWAEYYKFIEHGEIPPQKS